jgi:hypothetical protein
MVVADNTDAYFVGGLGSAMVQVAPLSPGEVHMVTAHDVDDITNPRVARHLPLFRAAQPPEPPDNWATWRALLADGSGAAADQIHVQPRDGFGTVSSALLALPAPGVTHSAAVWWFDAGTGDYQKRPLSRK